MTAPRTRFRAVVGYAHMMSRRHIARYSAVLGLAAAVYLPFPAAGPIASAACTCAGAVSSRHAGYLRFSTASSSPLCVRWASLCPALTWTFDIASSGRRHSRRRRLLAVVVHITVTRTCYGIRGVWQGPQR